MTKTPFSPSLVLFLLCAECCIAPSYSHALAILSRPSFTTTTNAPLAGLLQVTTDTPSRVSVSVSEGTNIWKRSFYDYGTVHSLPLLGFKAYQTNEITVTVHDRYGNEATASEPVVFITDPLPSDFPGMVLLESQPGRMEPGYTLFRIVNNNAHSSYITIVDQAGEVVWYSGIATTLDVRQLPNGDLFIPLATNFVEVNMLGQTVQTWNVPADWAINFHDGVLTDHGTILYLNDASRTVTNFPTSSTNPNAPLAVTPVLYNRVVEISATDSALLKSWSLIDMLQPTRIDYLTFTIGGPLGWDCEHANALIEDPRDGSIIVSLRHQDAIIKFSRATGQLKWILGPHENWGPQFQRYLLTPVGTPFQWSYGQHAPMITPQGTMVVYDDGNFRASPFDPGLPDDSNYSRAVEYDINEQAMEVSQVWDYGRTNAEWLFTDRVGNADWLPRRGNVLVTFGNVDYVNGVHPSPVAPKATMLRIKEVTHEEVPEVVFDLAVFDYGNTNSSYLGTFAYRSHRIPDLYAHPAQPVADLRVRYESGMPRLEFSADSARTYAIEASTDLVNWSAIGEPAEEGDGDFSFLDAYAADFSSRYYRVITR